MTDDANYYRDLEAQLDADFPIEGMRLDISTLRFQLQNRTKERDDARTVIDKQLAEVERLHKELLQCTNERDAERNPSVHLAFDVWCAMGYPQSEFGGYYERNGWADTWAALMVTLADKPRCTGYNAQGERCVLPVHTMGQHTAAGDVARSEPLPPRHHNGGAA